MDGEEEEEVIIEQTHVLKWDQGRRTWKKAAVHDSIDCRSFVFGDFLLYVAQYSIPPLAFVLDQKAEYPLGFTRGESYEEEGEAGDEKPAEDDGDDKKAKAAAEKKRSPMHKLLKFKWVALHTFLLIQAFLPLLLPTSRQITGIERYGPFIALLLGNIALPFLEALNTKPRLHVDIPLDQYAAVYVDGTEHTAADLLAHIESLSRFSDRKIGFDLSHTSVWSILAGLGAALISPTVRAFTFGTPLGKRWLDIPVVLVSNAVVGALVAVGFRAFLEAFALYRSMASGMHRLKRCAVGSDYEKKCAAAEHAMRVKEGEALSSSASSSSSSEPSTKVMKAISRQRSRRRQPPVQMDLTNPVNLSAWLKVHEALSRRSMGLEGKLVLLAASLASVILVVILLLLFVNNANPSEWINEMQDSSEDAYKRLFKIGGASLLSLGYLATVLGVSLCALTKIGSDYNSSASSSMLSMLYSVELHAHLDLRGDASSRLLTSERKLQLEEALKLLPVAREHLKSHVPHLGLFGFSYSELFFYISTMLVSSVTRYAMYLF